MSSQLSLEKRTVQGKKLKALRASGLIPSVIYGGEAPIMAASAYNATEKVLQEVGYHSTLELLLDNQPQLALVKSVSIDPVSRRIMNIEFQAVSADEIVEATTPIRFANFDSSDAAKLHYVLMPVMEEIEIKAKPSDLPEELVLDASKLATTEDKLTVADLVLPAGVELVDKSMEPITVIANVYDPVAEAAAREAEDQKAAEDSASTEAEAAAPAEDAKAE